MPRTMICTINVTVPRGEDSIALIRGEEVDIDTLPTGCVESMARLGQLVEVSDWTPDPVDSVPVSEPDDWKQTPVAELAVSDAIKAALGEAQLATAADVLAYGAENAGDLTKINGIGEASAKAVKAAIEKLAK